MRQAPLQHFELLNWSAKCRRQKSRPVAHSRAATTHLEHILNLFGENSFTDLTFPPTRIVQLFATSRRADALKHFRFALRKMFVEPVPKQRRHRPRQS